MEIDRRGLPDQYNPIVTGVVTTKIGVGELSLYEQAAVQTGYTVSVVATEGQPHSFWVDEMKTCDSSGTIKLPAGIQTITLLEGELVIAISRGPDQRDHGAFWEASRALISEQRQPK